MQVFLQRLNFNTICFLLASGEMAFLNKGLNLKIQDLRKEDGHLAEFNYSGGLFLL